MILGRIVIQENWLRDDCCLIAIHIPIAVPASSPTTSSGYWTVIIVIVIVIVIAIAVVNQSSFISDSFGDHNIFDDVHHKLHPQFPSAGDDKNRSASYEGFCTGCHPILFTHRDHKTP